MQLPSSSYIGRHAGLYDLFYAGKAYREEAAFIHACLQTYGDNVNNILELACGTGTHAFLLENYGYEITATDYSVDMLKVAQTKGQASHSAVNFQFQDMRELGEPQQPRDAVLCLFDSIGYVASNESILKVLNGVNRQLREGGLFICEFWHAGAMLRNFDPLHVRRFQTQDGEIERISETSIDYKESLCHVAYTIHEFHPNGTFQKTAETQINRFFLIQEMRLLLESAKLTPLKWFAGYRENEQINAETWHILSVSRKAGQL